MSQNSQMAQQQDHPFVIINLENLDQSRVDSVANTYHIYLSCICLYCDYLTKYTNGLCMNCEKPRSKLQVILYQ